MVLYFNSSKVRLEQIASSDKLFYSKFQFQQGTIGTQKAKSKYDADYISIPARYDWNACRRHSDSISATHFNSSKVRLEHPSAAMICDAYAISIPARYDWNRVSSNYFNYHNEISIPARYDWNTWYLRSRGYEVDDFNSSKVRLEQDGSIGKMDLYVFQFQQGTIGTQSLNTS